jgi:hypothetical protein
LHEHGFDAALMPRVPLRYGDGTGQLRLRSAARGKAAWGGHPASTSGTSSNGAARCAYNATGGAHATRRSAPVRVCMAAARAQPVLRWIAELATPLCARSHRHAASRDFWCFLAPEHDAVAERFSTSQQENSAVTEYCNVLFRCQRRGCRKCWPKCARLAAAGVGVQRSSAQRRLDTDPVAQTASSAACARSFIVYRH